MGLPILNRPGGFPPVPSGLYEGVDQGVDYSASPGDYLFAVASGVVSKISPAGSWAGGTGEAAYVTLDTPIVAGGRTYKQVYYAEEHPVVTLGQHVYAGDRVAQFVQDQSEIGFAEGNEPAAPRPAPRPANQWTQAGQDFRDWMTASGGAAPPSSPSATTPQTTTPDVSGGGIGGAVKSGLCLGCSLPIIKDTPICSACKAAVGAEAGAVGAITSIPDALAFLFSYRFLEIVGGGLLLLVGLFLLGRQLGVTVPVPGPVGAAAVAAAA